MTELNITHYRQTLERVIAEATTEGSWDQGQWMAGTAGKRRRVDASTGRTYREMRCGTAFCMAGYACHIAGDAFVVEDWCDAGDEVSSSHVIPKGQKEARRVSSRAAELLGIRWGEAEALFLGGNDLDNLFAITTQIAQRRGIDPAELGVPASHLATSKEN